MIHTNPKTAAHWLEILVNVELLKPAELADAEYVANRLDALAELSSKLIAEVIAAAAKVANKELAAAAKLIDINSAHKDHKAITKLAYEPHSRVKATVKPGKGLKLVKAPAKKTSNAAKTLLKVKPTVKTDKPALTPGMHDLLVAYAKDAGNWSGNPLVGGNVGGSKQDAGTLMHLKMRKFVTTQVEPAEKGRPETQWLYFTPLAVKYLAAHNVTVVAK